MAPLACNLGALLEENGDIRRSGGAGLGSA